MYASIAQGLERLSSKQEVVSSNLTGGLLEKFRNQEKGTFEIICEIK